MVVAAVYRVPCAIYRDRSTPESCPIICLSCYFASCAALESHRTTTAYRYSVSASHFFFELLISQARGSEGNKAAIPESKFFQKSLS